MNGQRTEATPRSGLRLTGRLLLAQVVVWALLMAGLASAAWWWTDRQAQRELGAAEETVRALAADALTDPVRQAQRELVSSLLRALTAHPAVCYAAAYDAQGQLVGRRTAPRERRCQPAAVGEPGSRASVRFGEVELGPPDKRVGRVELGFATSPYSRSQAQSLAAVLLVLTLALGASFMISVAVARWLLGPLRRLVARSEALAAGRSEHGDASGAERAGRGARDTVEHVLDLLNGLRDTAREAERGRDLVASVLEALPNGLLVLDRDLRVKLCNGAACGLLGRTADELVGLPLEELMASEGDGAAEVGEQLVPPGRAPSQQLRVALRMPEGTSIPASVSAARVPGQGPHHDLVVTALDLSAFNRLKAELTSTRDALRSAEGERRQTEQALHQSKRSADLALQARAQFLANMSHELRTPLNGVLGLAELLGSTPLDPTQHRYVAGIEDSARALLAQVSDVLDFAALQAGGLRVAAEPFSPAELVESTASAFARQAADRGLELLVVLGDELPPEVLGDRDRLRHVVRNLLSNALKFTTRGEVVVGAEATPVGPGGAGGVELRLSVADTGVGIDPAEQRTIFEAFVQADGSASRPFGGAGLGLTIAARLVRHMGGRIWLDSMPGQGSTFHVQMRLPLPAGQPALPTQPVLLTGLRALVIDDNGSARELLERLLAGWGVGAATAADEAQALELAARSDERFDVLLLDEDLPGRGGAELARALAERPACARARLILLRARHPRADGATPGGRGADAVVRKPVLRAELLDALLGGRNGSSLAARGVKSAGTLAGAPPRTAVAGGTVLLAEDNPVNRLLAQRVLERAGHTVVTVSDGREALRTLLGRSFDLAVLDVQMPGLSGLEVAQQLRQSEEGGSQRLPVLALTAHGMKGDRERCLQAGMDDYLAKPVRSQELIRTVSKLIQQPAAPSTPADPSEATTASGVPPRPKPEDVVDWPSVLRRCMGDEGLAGELAAIFVQETPRLRALLRSALDGANRSDVEYAAHTLKGMASNVSAEAARQAGLAMELAARGGEPFERLEALSAEVERSFDQVSAQLGRRRQRAAAE